MSPSPCRRAPRRLCPPVHPGAAAEHRQPPGRPTSARPQVSQLMARDGGRFGCTLSDGTDTIPGATSVPVRRPRLRGLQDALTTPP